jgi:transposase
MKNLQKFTDNNYSSCLPVFVDISKETLDYSVGWAGSGQDSSIGQVSYRVEALDQWISGLIASYELDGGYQLKFVCEPTGGLQHKLALMAEKYQASLHFVDTERMYNARMITYGNSEKTDEKDPGAMRNLYLIGKSRQYHSPDVLQQTVRSLSREYEDLSQQAIRARNKIHSLLGYVFVDYSKPARFTFGSTGQALAAEFGFCPQYIVRAGYVEFARRIKAHVPRVRWASLKEIWAMAERSVGLGDPEFPDPRADYLSELYKQWVWLEQRKDRLTEQLHAYAQLYRQQGWFPKHRLPSVSDWMLVRVIAETGPLQGFEHIRQLWAYLGIKLARRQSGKYKGKIKITKKGPALARKLLYQICLPLVKSDGWMHPIYNKQNPKRQANGKGIRAINVVMRKLVGVIFSMQKTASPFQVQRLGNCESQYRGSLSVPQS